MTEQTAGGSRGAEDIEFKAAIGRAIRAARGDMTQPELAQRSSIDQPTISRLERGSRISPLNLWEMRAIERATGRPPGFILSQIGYLPRRLTTAQALMADPNLSAEARVIISTVLDTAHAMSDEDDETPVGLPK